MPQLANGRSAEPDARVAEPRAHHRNGNAAAEVVERIRALYRQAPLSKEPLSVNEVIEDVCRLIEPETRRRSIALHAVLDDALPKTFADRIQLQQLLMNLTRNAIESLELFRDSARELHIETSHDAGGVIVGVRDTGPGVADPASVFEPFVTTKPSGMGMGITICRSIVKAHGGQLWASAVEPHGAVFKFSLPLLNDSAVRTAPCGFSSAAASAP